MLTHLGIKRIMDGKVVLVTGGTLGIGRAIVEDFLQLGASVVTCARNTSPLAVLLQQHSTALLAVAADVSTADGRAAVLDAALQKHGRLDVLVNNVGTNIRKASTEFTDDEYDLLCATNQGAPFHLSRHCFKHLAATQGCVVNISSISGQASDNTGVVYAMNKAAIDHMTRYLAVEWAGHGVRVNAVAPWFIETPLTAPILKGALLDDVKRQTPMGRVGNVREVSGVVTFLCSKAAGYTTGQVIAVDGGLLSNGFETPSLTVRPPLPLPKL